ncbi:hypothetical protein FOA52_013540 [Chlamydomonas sp. UWO 241]|nr:hypothetical protein FOA52_013540 [Chlamydomonas sp. UWO 241]
MNDSLAEGDAKHALMLGKGRKLPAGMRAVPNEDLVDRALNVQGKGKACVLVFQRAEFNEASLTGTDYRRARKRINCFVAIQYETWQMAKVLCFIKVPHVDDTVPPLRLAIFNFYSEAEEQRPVRVGALLLLWSSPARCCPPRC